MSRYFSLSAFSSSKKVLEAVACYATNFQDPITTDMFWLKQAQCKVGRYRHPTNRQTMDHVVTVIYSNRDDFIRVVFPSILERLTTLQCSGHDNKRYIKTLTLSFTHFFFS